MELDEESSLLCTFNTSFGCYKFNQLPFGVRVAKILQMKLDHAYEGIPNVMGIADDIIAGSTPEEHDEALLSMFEASRKNNIGLNSEKLQFKASLVNFFGHTITSQGFEPAREVGHHQEPEGTCQQQRAPRCSRHDHVPQPILS